jgi:adenosyl cobinamide kinase/adenosyl cobinamide phosphate guanylyltransferase
MIVLVLGGTRSGKSDVGERRAESFAHAAGVTVTYVATALDDGEDTELAARIRAHQQRRPTSWHTREAGVDLVGALRDTAADEVILVDSLGPWLATHLERGVDVEAVVVALRAREAPVVLVSDEVGLGVHPSTAEGRRFRDLLGELNRAIAEAADEVVLVVAGRVLPLERA